MRWRLLAFLGSVFLCSQAWAASVKGQVVNAVTNEAIPRADLTLTCLAALRHSSCKENAAQTATDGTFLFDRVLPGRHRLTASKAGLVSTKASRLESELDSSHGLSGVVLKLSPEATIRGKVVDEEGQPKGHVKVAALRQLASSKELRDGAVAVSEEDGTFLLRWVAAGDYYVATALPSKDATERQHPFLLFAPSALNLDEANRLHVDVGQNYAGIELRWRPILTHHIEGRAQLDTNGVIAADQLEVHLDSSENSGVFLAGREIALSAEGKFEANVPPGAYTLRLTGTASLPQTTGPKNSGPTIHLFAKQEIEVSGKDVYGILLLIPPPITVSGHVSIEGEGDQKIESGKVTLAPYEAVAPSGPQTASLEAGGVFSVTNCDPANYAVRFSPPAGTYIKSIVFNGRDEMTHLLDLTKGSGGALEIVLRPGPAALSGTLQDSASSAGLSESAGSFEIAAIPDLWTDSELTPIRHAALKDGHFSITGIAPGRYRVMATVGVDRPLWQMAKFVQLMQQKGVAVELGENEQKDVAAPILTSGELEQFLRELGDY